jgi:hypothetical protein
LVVAGRAHKYAKSVKALDLRLELRRELAEYRQIVMALPRLIEQASQSRQSVAAATGGHGGALQIWLEQQTKDLGAAVTLERGLPNSSENYADLDPQELEDALAQLHALRLQAFALQEKYHGCLAADNKSREQIAAAMRTPLVRPGGMSG